MGRAARIGLGAGILTGAGAVAMKVRRTVTERRTARRARADEARRNLWPPVPVKPAAGVHIDGERAESNSSGS
jgi:hypothetical protein